MKPLFTILLLSMLICRSTGQGGVDNGEAAQPNLRTTELINVKVYCLFILLAFTFAGSISQYFYRCNESFPFSFMLTSAGYLLTMLSDSIIILVTMRSKRENGNRVDVGVARPWKVDEDLETHPVFVRTTKLEDTILLIFALCFHSVFEGIAIGVSG